MPYFTSLSLFVPYNLYNFYKFLEFLLCSGNNVQLKQKDQVVGRKHELKTSMQELASRAASRVMATAGKSITAPKTAYEFEVSWRALSDDYALQTQLLKVCLFPVYIPYTNLFQILMFFLLLPIFDFYYQTIPPATLPQIFKNALSSPILMDIIKCTATFFK